MLQVRANFVFAVFVCATTLVSDGCSTPLAAPLPAASNRVETVPPQVSQKPLATAEPNLAGVFDKLQQVREIDPSAEQKLVEELRRTPAESWPLVAEQFRASLAYREQLKATNPQQSDPQSIVAPVSAETPSPREPATLDSRPSVAIGALADPRRADKDGVALVTEKAPYTMQIELANAVPPTGSPGDEQITQTKRDSLAGDVIQAKLETTVPPVEHETMPATDDDDWQQLVKRAVEDLSGRVVPSPTTTAEIHQHVSLRMLRLLSGHTEQALEPIPHISPVEQDFWSRQLFALATYLDHHAQPDDKRRAAASVVHLDESVSHLRELGTLALRNLAFCKNVYGYGAIETYEKDNFSPGERVSLYVEVENYHSQSTEKGFHTLLGSSYELLNEAGQRVGGEEFPDVDDYCRSRRRDFHIQFGIKLPEKLAAGPHRLRVIVKDRQSEKMATAEAAFEIRGAK